MESSFSPMLATAADVVPEGDGWIIEGKFDGWRGMVHVRDDGTVRLYGGRNGASYSGQVPYIEQAVCGLVPPDTVLDGELVGGEWGDVQGIMTGGGAHVPSKHSPALTYVVFDIVRLAGDDTRSKPWHERRAALEALIANPVRTHEHGGYLSVSPSGPASAEMHEKFLALGLEGSVCKRKDSRYVGRRSPTWVKIKPQSTADAKIVGFKPGKKGGRWDGKCGAFIVELVDSGARTTVKCGTDARHEDATDHPERWDGVIIEITHLGIQKSGVPKSPQFFRRRDDRSPAPAPKQPPKQTAAPRASKRNYGAMKDPKLLRTIDELRRGEGEAMRKTDTPEADLEVATAIAVERGLEVAAHG